MAIGGFLSASLRGELACVSGREGEVQGTVEESCTRVEEQKKRERGVGSMRFSKGRK
jgi:hypothetical protein